MYVLVLLGLWALLAKSGRASDNCRHGPEYWCQSLTTAKECDVVEFCQFKWDGKFGFSNKLKVHMPVTSSPVNVTVYLESLCPDSRKFVLEQLYPTFTKLQSTGVLNVNIVPYGKASQVQESGQWVFTCQHGPAECYGNLIDTCAIHYMQSQSLYIPFVNCLFSYEPNDSTGEYCAQKVGFSYGNIKTCVHGSEGNSLEHDMGVETESLSPRATFIPWITVNGIHTDDIQQGMLSNMLQYVCNAYTGPRPSACS